MEGISRTCLIKFTRLLRLNASGHNSRLVQEVSFSVMFYNSLSQRHDSHISDTAFAQSHSDTAEYNISEHRFLAVRFIRILKLVIKYRHLHFY